MVAPTLEILSGDLSGRTYAVDDEEFVIGRSKTCHIVIPKRYVSREHARICREGTDYIVDGLSEKNPVHIRSRPIREHLLSDGDVFEFCGIKIRFCLPERSKPRGGRGVAVSGGREPARDRGRAKPGADEDWHSEDSWKEEGGAEDSWQEEPKKQAPAEDSWSSGPQEDSWEEERGKASPDEESWGAPAQQNWDDEESEDESWADNLNARAKKRSGTHDVSRGSGVRFGEGEEESAEGTGEIAVDKLSKLSSRGSGSGSRNGESENEQTAELNAEPVARDLDDPDYDPFAEVEATKKRGTEVDPQREKAIRILSVVGFMGILLAVGIYMQVTKPGEWKKVIAPNPIRVAVGQTIRFDEPWAGIDPPAGRLMPNARGEPYFLEEGTVAKVEWVVPHVQGRAILLVHGLQEGDAFFQLKYKKSRRIKEFQVVVDGDDPHDLARDKRREEYRKLPRKKLMETLASARSTGDTYRERREFAAKESFFRLAWLEYSRAVDAAEALRGKGSSLSEAAIRKIEDAEQKARDDYDSFVEREFAIYKALVKKGEPQEDRVDQLRRTLRSISHTCDIRYKRLSLILREFYGDRVNADGNEYCEHDGAN